MGVSISCQSTQPVEEVEELVALIKKANDNFDWWCEPISIWSDSDEPGHICGAKKIFCMIDDVDTDTYMAYLDVCQVVKVFSEVAAKLNVGWKLDIEGGNFGKIASKGPDKMLQASLASFLDAFPGEFEKLMKTPREKILKKWADR
jgi:hypothetical protein